MFITEKNSVYGGIPSLFTVTRGNPMWEQPVQCKDIAPFAADYRIIDGKTTVYICENFACQQPTTNIEEAIQTLISSRD